jgi:PAS domain S-box-containing protein
MLYLPDALNILLKNSFDGVVVFNQNLELVAMNEASKEIFLLEDDCLKNSPIFELLPLNPDLINVFRQVIFGESLQIKSQSFRKSKTRLKTYFHLNLCHYTSPDGTNLGLMIVKDISESVYKEHSITKKRLKDALKAFDFGNDRLKHIINSCEELIMAIDTQFHITLYNHHFKNYIFQKTGLQIHIGSHLLKIFEAFPEEQQRIKARWEKVLKGENLQMIDQEIINGEIFYLDSNVNLVKNQEGKIIGGSQITRDITKSKHAEQQLKDSEAQKSALVHAFPDMIFQLDYEGRIIDVSDNNELIPYPNTKMVGRNVLDFAIPKKIKNRFLNLIAQAKNSQEVAFYEFEIPMFRQSHVFETRFINSGENRILVIVRDITKRRYEEHKVKELLSQAQLLNENLETQNQKLAQQEEKLAQVNLHLRQQNQTLEQAKDDLLHSQNQLQETLKTLEERNFELDQFVYKTSHDLRSPLSSVLGIIHLLNIEPDAERIPEYINRIEGRILRLDDFIQSMLHYSRNNRAEAKIQLIHLDELVDECLEDLKFYKNFDQVEINSQIIVDDTDFCSDLLRLKIIFANLISNAIKYQDFDKTQRHINIIVQAKKEKIVFSIDDNGIGIAPEYLENIYNMFFRATEASEGSGLGLYIVKQTIDKLQGIIQIKSEGLGKGLQVQVEIPNLKV